MRPVDRIPDDPEARREWLERWVAERGAPVRPPARSLHNRLAMSWAELVRRSERYADHVLDRRLETGGHVWDEAVHGQPGRVGYGPTAWHVLPRALRYVGAAEKDVLVDFGCGKGRVLHQAAKWPLRRVIGVEVSPELADFARGLLVAHRGEYRCKDIEVVVSDAALYEVPDDLTIAYLYDPFRGEILDTALRNIVASIDRRPRRVWLIHVHPRAGARVLETGRFRLRTMLRGGLRDVQRYRTAIFESC